MNWRDLNKILVHKNEAEVLALLNDERQHGKRVVFLERLHQRYNALRVARERIELLREAKAP